MIKETKNSTEDIIKAIPESFKVLDVGGVSGPYKRADAIIDIAPFSKIDINTAKGPGKIHFSKEGHVQHDICDREPWPFNDKQFDYSICSHVLEDLRDPIWVCSEIIRVSKAGYIEVPSRLYETTFGLETKKLAGAAHHRWIVDIFEGRLRFTFKHMQVHLKEVNQNRKHLKMDAPEMLLRIEWSDNFDYYENWLSCGKEIFEFYKQRKLTDKETWRIFRKISSRNFIIRWLSYFKNTNKYCHGVYKLAIKARGLK